MTVYVLARAENFMENGEIIRYELFLLLLQCIQKLSAAIYYGQNASESWKGFM